VTKFYDLVKVNIPTTGTGTVTLGTTVAGHISFLNANVQDGDTVRYVIIDGSDTEVGTGVVNMVSGTMTRSLVTSTTNALLNLSGNAQLMLTFAAEDLLIANMGDVSPATPADGQTLIWNASIGKYVPGSVQPTNVISTPQIRQSAHARGYVSGGGTLTATLPSAPAAGNMLLVIATNSGGWAGPTLSSGWTQDAINVEGTYVSMYVEHKTCTGASDNSFSITQANSGPGDVAILIMEIVGSSGIQLIASQGQPSSSTTPVSLQSKTYTSLHTLLTVSTYTDTSSLPATNYPCLFLAAMCAGNTTGACTPISPWTNLWATADAENCPLTVVQTTSWTSKPAMVLNGGLPTRPAYMSICILGGGTVANATTGGASDGQVPVYDAAKATYVATSFKLSMLADVNITEGAGIDKTFVRFDNASGKFIAHAANLSELGDFSGSPADGQVPTWSASASKWVPATPAGSGSSGSWTSQTGEAAWTPPTTSTFTTFRSGSSSAGAIANMAGSRGVRLSAPFSSGNNNSMTYAVLAATTGATGCWSAVARIRRHFGLASWGMAGLFLRNSTSGKGAGFWLGSDAVQGFNFDYWNNDDWWNSVGTGATWTDHDAWAKAVYDGTNMLFYVSMDGDAWMLCASFTASSFFTDVPTHVGIGMNPNFGGNWSGKTFYMDCLSWAFTSY